MSHKPYSNIHVVELGARTGASTCGRLLADLGATVYVIEARSASKPPKGKWRDRIAAVAGKESLLADPSNPDDIQALTELISACNVVVRSSDLDEDHWPASLYQAIADCPIVCDITAFGSTGPLAGRSSEEWELQALTGIMHTTGLPTEPPIPVGVPVVEMSSGLYAAAAISVALRVHAHSGIGQSIEIALYDVAINTLTTFVAPHYAGLQPRRLGNGHGMAVPWNAYNTSDGWILICTTNDAQWNRLKPLIGSAADREKYAALKLRLIYREEIDALMRDWTSTQTLDALEALLNQSGIPCGRIAAIDSLAQEPNLKFRGTVQQVADPVSGTTAKVCSAIYRFMGQSPSRVCIPEPDSGRAAAKALLLRPKPVSQPRTANVAAQALQGLRVIEIGQLTTAPLAARHLATLGAEVIKVEPPDGESARAWEPKRNGISHFFVVSNGEKRSISLDLQNADDRDYMSELIKDADILLENMKPGALARMGFGYERLQTLNPNLIYCAISGFGIHSAYPGRAAVDTVIQAMSGIMDTTRSRGTPVKAGISVADIAGGQTGLLLVLAALAWREQTGQGCAIDISMQDVGAWMTQYQWNGAQAQSNIPAFASSVGDACTHEQTRARELIQLHQDANGQSWEVFASPMRLSLTPARLGTLIGPTSRDRLRWRPRTH
ncbi:hypothetical protein CR155_13480 [Pollutimonas nitritireducens]|uniref:CoA transferase n=1 Tax=Pollutimonas nitritireducens TaxID=2045209 RepID=A0A2N4UE53_9BURK|nr:CoA transferase [Pollutimonas nitritireducens]PLC53289.1 hypothetical protein CR155_13480 [Pollutimonas nitritireducens]